LSIECFFQLEIKFFDVQSYFSFILVSKLFQLIVELFVFVQEIHVAGSFRILTDLNGFRRSQTKSAIMIKSWIWTPKNLSEVWISINLTNIDSSREYLRILLDSIIGCCTLSSFFLFILLNSFINVTINFLEYNISFFCFYHEIPSNFIYAISSSSILDFLLFFVEVLGHLHLLFSQLLLLVCTFKNVINPGLFQFKIMLLVLTNFI